MDNKSLLQKASDAFTRFSYGAAEDKGRRKSPLTRIRHEQQVLPRMKRERLQATAQDQNRDHSIVAWMVRKHLDYVSSFHFSFRTADPDATELDPKSQLDTLVNRIFKWHGAPRNIDFFGRFGRDELFRLFELEKVICGDAGFVKLADLKLMAVESDMIARGGGFSKNTTEADKAEYPKVNDAGLLVDEWGKVVKYAICNRGADGNFRYFDHLEPFQNVIFDAYWTRFSSQWRGVSPLSTAINTVADIHEALEYNIIKAKMHALFGVAITRKSEDGSFGAAGGAPSDQPSATAADPVTEADKTLDPRSINILDLEPGEGAQVIESTTPSTQFIEGMYFYAQIAMIALDIPVASFDSRRSSFSARIADLNEYEVSCNAKRTKNRYVRQEYSNWVLETIWNDPDTPWPLKAIATKAGYSLRDVQEAAEWVAAGSPWLDKYKQVQGDQLAIGMALDNPIDAARRRGSNVFTNIEKTAQVLRYAERMNVPVLIGETPVGYIEENPNLPPQGGTQ
jgi:capsid protein